MRTPKHSVGLGTTAHQYTLDEVLRCYSRLVHLGYPEKGALSIIKTSYPERAAEVEAVLNVY